MRHISAPFSLACWCTSHFLTLPRVPAKFNHDWLCLMPNWPGARYCLPLTLRCAACSAVTENTRASYPIEYIDNARIPCMGPHPKNLILLCCDAFGVLPPVSRLTREQAMYHFISGYTAKVGLAGVWAQNCTVSACWHLSVGTCTSQSGSMSLVSLLRAAPFHQGPYSHGVWLEGLAAVSLALQHRPAGIHRLPQAMVGRRRYMTCRGGCTPD